MQRDFAASAFFSPATAIPAPGLPQVQTLAFDEKINLPLTIAAAPSDGSAGGTIHPDAAVTVILYRDQTVTANFAYRADELQEREIDKVLKGVQALADE